MEKVTNQFRQVTLCDRPDIQEILQRISEITVQRVEETGILDEKDGQDYLTSERARMLAGERQLRLRRSPAGGVLSPEALVPMVRDPIVVHIVPEDFRIIRIPAQRRICIATKRDGRPCTYRAKYWRLLWNS